MSYSVNKVTINQLKELLKDDFQMLVATFLSDCETRLNALEMAIEENNIPKIKELAHSFKGSCSSVGAEKLSEISFKLEMIDQSENASDVLEAFQLLTAEYQLVKDFFQPT